ncbi:MAG: ABC transporter ATP-binding protein [Ruminococcus sp.]|nr:ABC transporter ATP-binding protein [Ruminococcus sp.]
MGEVFLEANGLYKTYGSGQGQVKALNGVSMQIFDGELMVILGSSGSGKSTLLNMLGGMDKPDKGSIMVDGQDLCRLRDKGLTKYRKEKVGFVFQSFNLITELSAYENVSLTADRAADPQIVEKMLELVGLGHKKDKYPTQLSGGEQQRVSIARALAKNARMLLCDEPTGALDYETGKQILIELEKLSRVHGQTVVIVTHTREIGRMADRVIHVRNGKIIETEINEEPIPAERIEW